MSESTGPTQYLESNAILAAQQHDTDLVREILAGMHKHELRALGAAAYLLGDLCREIERHGNSHERVS